MRIVPLSQLDEEALQKTLEAAQVYHVDVTSVI
jgi:hypothetical protein